MPSLVRSFSLPSEISDPLQHTIANWFIIAGGCLDELALGVRRRSHLDRGGGNSGPSTSRNTRMAHG